MCREDVIASRRSSPCEELELEVNTPFLSPLYTSGQAEAVGRWRDSQHHSGDGLSNCRAKTPSRPCLTSGHCPIKYAHNPSLGSGLMYPLRNGWDACTP